MSNVFIKNNYRTFNVPIFASFTFNLAPRVKWNADGGIFMSFGIGGKQKATIYNAKVNELGQLVQTYRTRRPITIRVTADLSIHTAISTWACISARALRS